MNEGGNESISGDGLYPLPENWKWVILSDIGDIVAGGTPSTSDPTNFSGDIPWITPADLSGFSEKLIKSGKRNISSSGLKSSSAILLPAGSVLFSSREPIGYVAIAVNPLCTNQGFKNIIPNDNVTSDYLYHYLRTCKELAESRASGTTFLEISKTKFSLLPIPLPPLDEQHRIVAKLESILSQIRTSRVALEHIPALLKAFRQSVLAAAMSGRLIGNDGADQADHLPLLQLIRRIKTGPFGSTLHKSDYVFLGIPLVNPMHINEGQIVPSDGMTISKEKAEELSEFRLGRGDVVLARRGAMGRCAVVQAEQEGWLCGSGSMILRPTERVLPEYLQIFLSSPDTVDALEENSVGTTMSNLNQKILLDLVMRVPSIEDQCDIIQRIKKLLIYTSSLEAAAQAATRRLDVLEQAALSKAFRGEL